ncbi:MAG: alpha/beta fold hydrolase, partial [Ilumatobacteraceae bacterium]
MPHTDNHGTRIAYEVIAGTGPPLILHHGLSDSSRGWHDGGYVAALRRDCTLVLIDARGHGESTKPHEPEAYHPPEVLATDVLAVMDALFIEDAHYFGYSMGGRVGFELARRAPGRLRSLVLGGAH